MKEKAKLLLKSGKILLIIFIISLMSSSAGKEILILTSYNKNLSNMMNDDITLAYVDEDVNGEKFVDYMVTKYDKYKIIYTEDTKWFLPQYSNQSCVKAWRKLPPFPLN